jgi:exopolysaccharide production protein ExoZ
VIAVMHVGIFRAAAAAEWVHTVAFFLLCFSCFRAGNAAAAVFSWTPLRWLGNMSYSYYLVHGFVVKAAMEILVRTMGHDLPVAAIWLLALPIFMLTLVSAALLFLLIEKPYSLETRSAHQTPAMLTAARMAR